MEEKKMTEEEEGASYHLDLFSFGSGSVHPNSEIQTRFDKQVINFAVIETANDRTISARCTLPFCQNLAGWKW